MISITQILYREVNLKNFFLVVLFLYPLTLISEEVRLQKNPELNTQLSYQSGGTRQKVRLPANPKTGKSDSILIKIPQTSSSETSSSQTLALNNSSRPINPTAPNTQTQLLRGDFTDTDGDGMTDVAELKYGFDPNDSNSFPQEPSVYVTPQIQFENPPVNAAIEVNSNGFTINWKNPADGNYGLILYNGSQRLYYGGHYAEYAVVDYSSFALQGNEILTGYFSKYALDRSWVENYPDFTIDLSTIVIPQVGDSDNYISYSFKDFPIEAEQQYRDFLQRVWVILKERLGPPAESFNCVITNMGADSSYFMITNSGRTFLSDTDFVPRLIVHEFIHAWKGSYTFTSDENWQYDNALSGFEEATAEGMAFEIIHEYVRSYPDDPATIQLLDWRPYQYWSSRTTYYDLFKYMPWTGAGDFWDPSSGATPRYSIAATTFQIILKENPNAYKSIMQDYYNKINEDETWRSNRKDLLDIWAQSVPTINGIETHQYLNAIPVFQGHSLDERLYVLSTIRYYGYMGDQQFATTYVNSDGMAWWGINKTKFESYNIPEWIDIMDFDPPDAYYYINTQDQPFTVSVTNLEDESVALISTRTEDLTLGSWPLGFGWKMVDEVDLRIFPLGLYYEKVSFDNYIQYTANAEENYYVFGYEGLNQNSYNEYIIMIGVDGVTNGFISIFIDSQEYSEPIENGVAVFRSQSWPFDLEGKFTITISDNQQNQHSYQRTLLEAGTVHNYFQTQFLIVDKDFNGIEDVYEVVDIAPEDPCSGNEAILENLTYNSPQDITCNVLNSVTVNNVEVNNGASLEITSGKIILTNFSAKSGSSFHALAK